METGVRSRRSGAVFSAPMGRSVRFITWGALGVLAAVVGFFWAAPEMPWIPRAAMTAFAALLPLATWLFSVRGYEVRGGALAIRRPAGLKRFSLAGLKEARIDPQAMRMALRLFGNGGLFCFCGWFWNRRLGKFRAYAADPRRAVVLVWQDRKLVVTPHDPEGFVQVLGAAQAAKRGEHGA